MEKYVALAAALVSFSAAFACILAAAVEEELGDDAIQMH